MDNKQNICKYFENEDIKNYFVVPKFDKYDDTLNIYLRKGRSKLYYIDPFGRLNGTTRDYGKIKLEFYGYNSILCDDFYPNNDYEFIVKNEKIIEIIFKIFKENNLNDVSFKLRVNKKQNFKNKFEINKTRENKENIALNLFYLLYVEWKKNYDYLLHPSKIKQKIVKQKKEEYNKHFKSQTFNKSNYKK
jgi:hypothetical protein